MDCRVSSTEVTAKVIGESETREYSFAICSCSNYIAPPIEEIEELGLKGGDWGKAKLASVDGLVEVPTYFADGELMGQKFSGILVPSDAPKLGYHLLQNLRFKVNPVTHELEKVPDDEIHPPFLNLGGRVV